MSIGEVLADADRPGWVSASVRSAAAPGSGWTIIWGIEQDDYSACGGDFYVRGHIRAIAGAVGVDSSPPIHQFDATHQTGEEEQHGAGCLAPGCAIPASPGQPGGLDRALCAAVLAIFGWGAYHVASAAAIHQGQGGCSGPPPSGFPSGPAQRTSPVAFAAAAPVAAARAPHRCPGARGDPGAGPGPGQRGGVRAGGPGQGDNPQRAGLAIDGSRLNGLA